MKIGMIRCMQTEDMCAGTADFEAVREKCDAFRGVEEDIEIIGFISCGGCPGKRAVSRALNMVNRGADTIVFTSCISRGTPIGYACPFAKKMIHSVRNAVGSDIRILDYTHD